MTDSDGYPPEGAARQDLRGFGCLRGKIWIAKDFDEPLEDFKGYTA